MTYEEALRGMKLLKIKLRPCPQDVEDICDKAIEALEKQTPKKPILKYVDWYGTGAEELSSFCPTCGRELEGGQHHCWCGQWIDWSEEE